MAEHPERPERTANEPPEHLTFTQAGERLGLSPDAVRMRARRGTLATIRINDRPYVLWPQPAAPEQPNEHRTERTAFANHSTVQGEPRLVAALEDRIASLEHQLAERTEEIRRRDHIIAGLVESLRALPAGQDATQDAIKAPVRDDRLARASDAQGPPLRRWWRRMTGHA